MKDDETRSQDARIAGALARARKAKADRDAPATGAAPGAEATRPDEAVAPGHEAPARWPGEPAPPAPPGPPAPPTGTPQGQGGANAGAHGGEPGGSARAPGVAAPSGGAEAPAAPSPAPAASTSKAAGAPTAAPAKAAAPPAAPAAPAAPGTTAAPAAPAASSPAAARGPSSPAAKQPPGSGPEAFAAAKSESAPTAPPRRNGRRHAAGNAPAEPAPASPSAPAAPAAEPAASASGQDPGADGAAHAGPDGREARQRPPRPSPTAPASAAATDGASPGRPQPTRSAGPGEGAADKAAIGSPLRSMEGGQAIHAAALRDAVTPHAKLPEFPPPAGERMPELIREEQRRTAIRAKEQLRREAEVQRFMAAGDESGLKKAQAQWAAEDALEYRMDPEDHELEVYPVNAPFAYVQIIRNRRTHETLYHVIEPKLTREERLLLDFVETTLVDVLDLKPEELDRDDLEVYIKRKFDQVAEDYSLRLGDEESTPEESRARLLYYVLRDFIGEGPIDVFLRDPMLEDISCDGPHQPVFIYHRKYESMTTTVRFRDHNHLDSFVIRMAQRAGKHVSIAEPILDATMRDGSRLQATLAKEVSTFGSTFTIRKFREVPFSPVDLVRFGTMSSQMLAYLWMVIANHQSGIYAGGTASGKTTAINAIMLFIPPGLKVITIEDTREINIPQPNWIAGLTRGGFGPRDSHGRQAGEIDMFQLLKNALRQRPEYIIVGEVRGAEAYNLFQAMATGHAAYGTMHADSVDAVIHRLESDPINIPRSLLEALDVVAVQIQTRVGGKRVRRTKQITEIVGLDPNTREILTNEVFRWEPSNDQFIFSGVSYSLERIAVETGVGLPDVLAELDDRRRVIEWMVSQEIRTYKTVATIISTYFHDKKRVMACVEEDLPWMG